MSERDPNVNARQVPLLPLIPSKVEPRLGRALTRVGGVVLREGNALTLLCDGPATYADWLAAIGRAQHWIHLENYIFKSDSTGRRFAEALVERAAAGVRVRVLYDWFGSLDVPGSFWRMLRRAGVDVRVVNPLFIGAPLDVVQRDHRKLLVVDGRYASLGGVCIADPWLDRSPVTGLPYRDTAVRVMGPAVAELNQAFARVWDNFGPPLPMQEVPPLSRIAPTGDMAVRVVAEEPGQMLMLQLLQLVLASVERRLWIADAYFLAVPTLRAALMAAARDGVDVRILLPSTNDLPLVGILSRYGYRPLLRSGVRIWEYAGLMMHAKTTVADGWWSRVGSTNLNVTGLLTNWELDLVVEDRRFGAQMEAMYEADLANAREIRLGGALLRQRPRPVRRESGAERSARRHQRRMRVPTTATVARVGAALQTAGSDTLHRHERTVGAAIGALLLSLSLMSARFPRLLAWPLAAVGALFGGISLVRAAQSAEDAPRSVVLPPVRRRRLRLRRRRAR